MLAKFQNPAEADKIMKIEKELEEARRSWECSSLQSPGLCKVALWT